MKETRICIIGGGGRLWAIQFMKDLAYNTMTHGTLVLYDIDKEAARNNIAVANQVFAVNKSEGRFNVIAIDDLGEALSGCDMVIISIEPGRTECRYRDLVLPEQYGILQSVGDTTGPGGIMRARRALPIFFDLAKKIESALLTACYHWNFPPHDLHDEMKEITGILKEIAANGKENEVQIGRAHV